MREIALETLEHEWLKKWWCDKYHRPSKDPLLAEYTEEELYVEFLMDEIEKDGGPAVVRATRASSLAKTATQRIEEAIDRGEEVDALDGIPDEERAMIEGFFQRRKNPRTEE